MQGYLGFCGSQERGIVWLEKSHFSCEVMLEVCFEWGVVDRWRYECQKHSPGKSYGENKNADVWNSVVCLGNFAKMQIIMQENPVTSLERWTRKQIGKSLEIGKYLSSSHA